MTPDEYDELAAAFLRKLAAADMKAWRANQRVAERGGHDDTLSPPQMQKTETPHELPDGKSGPHFMLEARNKAKAAYETKYVREHPCRQCSGNIFYTSTGGCAACAHKSRKAKASSSAGAAKTKKKLEAAYL
jgi:hypothetical protein